MSFTGGSWSFRYEVDNVEFGRLVGAYVAYRRARHRWAYWAWNSFVICVAGVGFGSVTAFIVSLTSIFLSHLFPKTENQDLSALTWGIVVGIVAIGLLGCLRYLNAVVNVPKSNGAFKLTVTVDNREVCSRTSGMNFSFELGSLREFVELKYMFVFVHPLTVLVFIPRKVFPNQAMAEEFAAFCRKALRDQV